MINKKVFAVNVFAALVLLFGLIIAPATNAVTSGAVPFGPSGGQGNGGVFGPGTRVSVSATGRYVAFISNASDLVSGDTGFKDVFVLDSETNTVTKESGVGVTGMPTTGHVDLAVMSRNGRYILLNHSQNGKLYLRDRALQQTTQINSSYSSVPSPIAISEDGRFAFYNRGGLYYYDLATSTETLVETYAANSTISCDGRFVAFNTARSLVTQDTNTHDDIYIADLMGGIRLKLITGSANEGSRMPFITCDGNNIAFTSKADNFVSGDTNGDDDVYKYSAADVSFARVSLAPDGSEYQDFRSTVGGANASYSAISIDGRYVSFGVTKQEPYIFGGFTTVSNDIYLRDTKTNTTTQIVSGLNAEPAFGYDFKKMYYVSNLNAGQGNLYQATNYL